MPNYNNRSLTVSEMWELTMQGGYLRLYKCKFNTSPI